jgi:hypothetical protein
VDRTIPTIIVIIVVLGVLALMWRSWRRRSRRDADFGVGYPRPVETAPEIAAANAFYVATTPRDTPLERLAVTGLGFRARARLSVVSGRGSGDGVVLALAGEEPVFIPAGAITRLKRATWAIDRSVETDGLLLLGWRLHAPENNATDIGTDVDSYFRIVDPADRRRVTDAITTIAPGAVPETTESEA